LRAVVYLASQAPQARTTDQIADATCVPKAYLSKVLQGLRRAGLVRSQRGVGGGMTLSRPPGELTVLDVVNAVDPIGRITTCPLNLPAHGVNLCPLHRRLDQALESVERAFATTSLAEILGDPAAPTPLCDIPRPSQAAS
jgi:Rrf2 family nitric oxide-sensitive transcriptional repressor